ncbi:efflux RND transporter periplasmic adaptor subunit [Mastigocoleus testarum]|uniref:RND transporter n=1 Tax=Mastigocoleus testarum BC008 TaxID=371196 RepID=A0A0V7ZFI1_9CYAN|nr:efflux RND transporter periplasmic adaptor subunit [Mastigocoleus testarum]KST63354.1 RND transporter [Mastigocoleus testarum BC008]
MATPIEIPLLGKIKYPSRWLIGGIISTTLIIGSITAYTIANSNNRRENITQLTVPVSAKNVTLRIEASGRVVPIKNVNLSPKNQGTLTSLYVEQGDQVKKGQIIARMDSADVRARILQARANLGQSKAQLEQAINGSRPQEISQARARLRQAEAQLTAAKVGNRPQEIAQAKAQVASVKARVDLSSERLRRYRALHKEGAVQRDTLDQYISEDNTAKANLQEAEKRLALLESGTRSEEVARLEASVAEAREALKLLEKGSRPEEIAQRRAAVAASEAQLKTEQVNLENTIIRAPFSGVITQKYTDAGAFVTPDTSASTSASATSSSIVALAQGLEILADVTEADIGRIRSGQSVEIVADTYPDEVFKGRVRLISPEAVKEEGVTLFKVRVTIETGTDKLRSGMNVNLTFLGDEVNNALLIPTVAILTEKGKNGVLVPDGNNQPQFREVTIGSQVQNETLILEGLQTDERVFLSPPEEYRIKKAREEQNK